MAKKQKRSHTYNNLYDDIKLFALFNFIYEKELSKIEKDCLFSEKFKSSYCIYKKKLFRNIKYCKVSEIQESTIIKFTQTLFFTKKKYQILDFCRHLRNSFSHALLKKDGINLYILDRYRGHMTSSGFLEYNKVIEFCNEIVKEYELIKC